MTGSAILSRSRLLSACIALQVTLAGCGNSLDNGSSGTIPAPVVDLTGTWVGNFVSEDALHSGTVEVVLSQDVEGVVSGESSFTTLVGDPTCWTTGAVANARVKGIVFAGDILRAPSGFVTVNESVLEVDLDAAGNLLIGDYSVRLLPTGSSCIGETGDMKLNRI